MQKVLTADQMREVDRLTSERYGIPSIVLMENAAYALAQVITEKLGGTVRGRRILIFCGRGNNGGDGAALGWKLALAGASVEIILFGRLAETSGDARINFAGAGYFVDSIREIDSLADFNEWFEKSSCEWDVVVDAIFGVGLNRPVAGWLAEVIKDLKKLRESCRLAVSVDIPSGLNADQSEPIGVNFNADITVTFTAPKPANVLSPASKFNGDLIIAGIGSPAKLLAEVDSQLFFAEQADASKWLRQSRFREDSYKTKRGHALMVVGSMDYPGAAVLAGNAAIRSGVGLVTLICPSNAKTEVASRLSPEVILSTLESDEVLGHIERADAIAVGCGLDVNDSKLENLIREWIKNRTQPMIIDASALTMLSPWHGSLDDAEKKKAFPLILTPHEGEFLRLIGRDNKQAIENRVAAAREFAMKHSVILVLKGDQVLIGGPNGNVVVNPTGNSGLGKAGNGDTLSGILAGFVAQAAKMNIDIFETVVAAVYIAGLAGDLAEKKYGKRVMTASDVRECLVDVFRIFEKQWNQDEQIRQSDLI